MSTRNPSKRLAQFERKAAALAQLRQSYQSSPKITLPPRPKRRKRKSSQFNPNIPPSNQLRRPKALAGTTQGTGGRSTQIVRNGAIINPRAFNRLPKSLQQQVARGPNGRVPASATQIGAQGSLTSCPPPSTGPSTTQSREPAREAHTPSQTSKVVRSTTDTVSGSSKSRPQEHPDASRRERRGLKTSTTRQRS